MNLIIRILWFFILTSIWQINNVHSEVNNVPNGRIGDNLFKLVVFSFDGFRHDYVDAKRTPNLYAIANAGVQGEMKSTFVTKTYPNHQSIATGLYQPYHGVINNNFIDPIFKSRFNVDNSSSFWWDQFKISVPIYIANQFYEANRYSIAIQWPGSLASYSDGRHSDKRIRVHYLQDYNPAIDWYKRIDLLIKWLKHPEKPANFAFVYFHEPDSHAHDYGPFSDQVLKQVENLDRIVGYFRKQLIMTGLAHRTNVIYLSDHGMAEVRAERSFYLEKCDHEYPGLKYKMFGSSPVWSILPISPPQSKTNNETLAESVRATLNECAEKYFNGKFRAYLQEEIPDNFHYKGNERILPIFLVADEGYDINYNDSGWRAKGYPIWGNHGYNASLPSMRPLFLAQGPRFKHSYRHPIPFENIDLYPLMLNLLDIPQTRFPATNGTFERVHQMLSNQLFLNDDDLLIPLAGDTGSNIWVRLFIYLMAGFLLTFITGACFVFAAGFNNKKTKQNSRLCNLQTPNSQSSKLGKYLRRLWMRNVDNNRFGRYVAHEPSYRMFTHDQDDSDDDDEHQRPIILNLNSSTDDNEPALQPEKQLISTIESHPSNVDWDIIGTGLDIDLASQINPERKADRNHLRYHSDDDDDSDNSLDERKQPKKHSKTKTKDSIKKPKDKNEEFVSLLISDDNHDDDNDDNDELIKAKINIKDYEDLFLDDNECKKPNDDKLIDI